MKKSMYLLSGVVLGVAIASSTPVLAATAKSIAAKINSSVSVAVNGEKVKLNAQPINHNNLNYLPVGEIGRALGLSINYDKKSDTINIVSPDETIGNDQSSQTTPEPPAKPGTEVEEVKTAKLGESITKDGVTMTIEKVEYMESEEKINTIAYPKGVKVYYKLTNNGDNPIRPTGTFTFKLQESNYEQEINNAGRGFQIDNQRTLYKGDSTDGFVHIPFSYKINNIMYTPVSDSAYYKNPIGSWSID